MITIAAEIQNGVFKPESDIPSDARAVVFNGVEYIVYQEGDNLPDIVEG